MYEPSSRMLSCKWHGAGSWSSAAHTTASMEGCATTPAPNKPNAAAASDHATADLSRQGLVGPCRSSCSAPNSPLVLLRPFAAGTAPPRRVRRALVLPCHDHCGLLHRPGTPQRGARATFRVRQLVLHEL